MPTGSPPSLPALLLAGDDRRRLLNRSNIPTPALRRRALPSPPPDVLSVRCSRCSSVNVFESQYVSFALSSVATSTAADMLPMILSNSPVRSSSNTRQCSSDRNATHARIGVPPLKPTSEARSITSRRTSCSALARAFASDARFASSSACCRSMSRSVPALGGVSPVTLSGVGGDKPPSTPAPAARVVLGPVGVFMLSAAFMDVIAMTFSLAICFKRAFSFSSIITRSRSALLSSSDAFRRAARVSTFSFSAASAAAAFALDVSSALAVSSADARRASSAADVAAASATRAASVASASALAASTRSSAACSSATRRASLAAAVAAASIAARISSIAAACSAASFSRFASISIRRLCSSSAFTRSSSRRFSSSLFAFCSAPVSRCSCLRLRSSRPAAFFLHAHWNVTDAFLRLTYASLCAHMRTCA
mmetsp:Transcript_3702/g.12693  ORF Transcript_3702/g.12693 Transcript_3702/m.12693 type:complete len:425 (-) Transcript_3702:899-2173(-)